jgi:hypothetical protein
MFAAMAFDAPRSEHQLGAWVVFFVVLSIPLWFVLGAITGWFLYLRNWLRASALIAATPIAATTMGWLLAAPATGITDAMGIGFFVTSNIPTTSAEGIRKNSVWKMRGLGPSLSLTCLAAQRKRPFPTAARITFSWRCARPSSSPAQCKEWGSSYRLGWQTSFSPAMTRT